MNRKLKQVVTHFIILLTLTAASDAGAQVIAAWTKTYGSGSMDFGYSVRQTRDGGYIVTGYAFSYSNGFNNVWLIKTDADGDTLWSKTFKANGHSMGYSVRQTADDGYIISGEKYSPGTYRDVWLIRTDAGGDSLWTKTYGGYGQEYGYSVQQTADGGYIIVGETDSFSNGYTDVWLIKTDADGDTLWTRTIGGESYDCGLSVLETSNNEYVLTGYTESYGTGESDLLLIKTDAAGDTLWTRTYGGNTVDWGYSLSPTADNGYILTGFTLSFGAGSYDVWLIKTDAAGDSLWSKTFGSGGEEWGHAVQQTSDGGYVIAGYTDSFGAGNTDFWLIKTDAAGDTVWTQTFGGSGWDKAYAIQQTSDEEYIITGYTESFGAGSYDVWLIKTDYNIDRVAGNTSHNLSDFNLTQNFPNPFNPKTSFQFTIPKVDWVTVFIYTISGQMIESRAMNLNAGTHHYEFDGSAYSTGIYIYRISASSGFNAGRKMLLLK
jgi:hypothetical protein